MLLGVGTGLPGLYDPIRQCHRAYIGERDRRQHDQHHLRQRLPALRQDLRKRDSADTYGGVICNGGLQH